MSQHKYKTAVVLEIQPEDETFCGECEWLDRVTNEECHLFGEDLETDFVIETCSCCGEERTLGKPMRTELCRQFECQVRDEK